MQGRLLIVCICRLSNGLASIALESGCQQFSHSDQVVGRDSQVHVLCQFPAFDPSAACQAADGLAPAKAFFDFLSLALAQRTADLFHTFGHTLSRGDQRLVFLVSSAFATHHALTHRRVRRHLTLFQRDHLGPAPGSVVAAIGTQRLGLELLFNF